MIVGIKPVTMLGLIKVWVENKLLVHETKSFPEKIILKSCIKQYIRQYIKQ